MVTSMRDPQRVVVIGQLARDLVLRVEQMPSRRGSVRVIQRLDTLGGKGACQAVGLARLGMTVTLIGAVGADEAADRVLAQAAAHGIDVSRVARRPRTSTALILTIVNAGGWDCFADIPHSALTTVTDIECAAEAIGRAGTVVIQLQQPPQATLAAARLGHDAGCRVVADGAPADDDHRRRLLAVTDVIRADGRAAARLAGHPIRDAAAARAAGKRLLAAGPSLVVLAAGADGNVIVWPGGSAVIPPGNEPPGSGPAMDIGGVGDAFIPALVTALATGPGPAERVLPV
jgi:ribokinase